MIKLLSCAWYERSDINIFATNCASKMSKILRKKDFLNDIIYSNESLEEKLDGFGGVLRIYSKIINCLLMLE